MEKTITFNIPNGYVIDKENRGFIGAIIVGTLKKKK